MALIPRSASRAQLPAQDLPRRGGDFAAVAPLQVGHHHRRPRQPRHQPQRLEVGDHLEVAVAGVPGGHRVAADRLHLDVDGEQVVAALGPVLQHVAEEVRWRSAACPAGGPPCRRSRAARCRPCRPQPPSSAPRRSRRERYARLLGCRTAAGSAPIASSISISRTCPVKCLRALAIHPIACQQDHDAHHQRRVVERLPGEFVVPRHRQRRERETEDDRDQAHPERREGVHPLVLAPVVPGAGLEVVALAPAQVRSGSRRRCRGR